jgi:1-phosphofructokinase
MIITVTLNPAVDKTVEIGDFEVGTVNRVTAVRLDAGGKGINVSKTVLSLGGKSLAVGILGGTAGSFIKDSLNSWGIDNDFHFIQGETRTNLKVVDSKRKTNTDINEPGPQISCEDMASLERKFVSHLRENAVVVFSGSVPANVEKDIYGRWIAAAKKAGAKTILDADGELLRQGIEAGPYLIKPNIHELERLYGTEIGNIREAERLSRSLMKQYGMEMAAVSLGEQGALFINREYSVHAHGIPVKVKSTVGAGDAMVAALAYSIDRGFSFEKSIKLAVASGTANVMTSGTQPAAYETIAALENQVSFEYLDTII